MMDKAAIEAVLPHRDPMLLIDEVIELVEGERVVARKTVTEEDCAGHFPGNPIMPGVKMVEALAQCGAVAVLSQPENRGKLALFAGIDDVRFKRVVRPGDVLTLECQVETVRGPIGRGKVKATVDGQLAVRGTLTFAVGERAVIARTNGAPISITGLGCHVPERVLGNDELSTIVDTNDEWIVERTGIRERRIAADDEALTDICLPAARRALEMAGADPASIDLLIVATVTPDMAFPSSSALMADTLGMPQAAAYDLSAGCTGFVYAIAQAHAMLSAGLAKRALVVGGDVLSTHPRLDRPLDARALRRRRGRRRDGASRAGRLPRLRARRGRRRRLEPLAARQRLAEVRRSGEVREDERPRGFQVRNPGDGHVCARRFSRSAAGRWRTSTYTSRTKRTSALSITLSRSSASRRRRPS